ncbi:MAG: endoribonuclease L-PSP [Lachnospiraceae bacterium]|nr:endoribonuclease L-PSP [Lachnospiraceae bacterium]
MMEELKTNDYKLLVISADNKQVFITLSNQNTEKDALEVCELFYKEIYRILNQYKISIFHERVFGSNFLYDEVCEVRCRLLKLSKNDKAFSYVDGSPVWGSGIAGINIHGIIEGNGILSDIIFNNKVYGKLWKREAVEYMILHSVHGKQSYSFYDQTTQMFNEIIKILSDYHYEFHNIIRTWIYMDHILDQYDEFNKARTEIFSKNKMWSSNFDETEAEEIYMPASTGIGCNNPFGCTIVADVLAVRVKDKDKFNIISETGKDQMSAFRYGSAFSRAMVLEEEESSYIYLSGTASINEDGQTVYHDDIDKQINKTDSVIKTLLEIYKMNLDDICEGTVFLKKAEFLKSYQGFYEKISKELPVIITIADVCRDDLLYEMDATFIQKNK